MAWSILRNSWRPAGAFVSLMALTGCEPPAAPSVKAEPARAKKKLVAPIKPTKPVEPPVKSEEPVLSLTTTQPTPPPPVDPPPPQPEPIASSLQAAAISRLFQSPDSAEAERLLGKRVELTGYVLQVRNLGNQRLVVLGDEHFTSDLPAQRVLCHIEHDMSEAANITTPRLRVTGTCQLGYGNLVVLRNCKIEEELTALEGFEERKAEFAAERNRAELERLGIILESDGDGLIAKLKASHFHNGHLLPEIAERLSQIDSLRVLSLSGMPISDEGLRGLPFLAQLHEITLDSTRISANGLAALASAAELRRVTLDGSTQNEGFTHLSNARELQSLVLQSNQGHSEFSDEAIAHLNAIRGLTHLNLDGARLTPTVMKWIAQQSELQSLSLEYTPINAKLLQELSGLTGLHSLSLRGSQFDDAAIATLRAFSNLEILDLSHTQITDAGLAQFAPAPSLRSVDLSGCRIVGNGLASLRGSKIESLSLRGSHADNEAILAIESMTSLKHLRLAHTEITPTALGRLAALQQLQQLDLGGIRLDREVLPVLEGLAGLRELRLSENPFADCDACLSSLAVTRPELKLYLGRYEFLAQTTAATP